MDVPCIYIDKKDLDAIDMHYYDALSLRTKSDDVRTGIRLLTSAMDDSKVVEFKKIRFIRISPEFNFECKAFIKILDKHNIYYVLEYP